MIIMIIIIICFALFILRTALIFFINLFINQGMVLRVNLSLALFFPSYIPSVNVSLLYAYMVVK